MHNPRGTDIPGQGGGVVSLLSRNRPYAEVPVVLISPVKVVVLLSLYKEQTVCIRPRGTDIPGQGGGVGVTSIKIQPVCSSPLVLIPPVKVVVLVVAPLVN